MNLFKIVSLTLLSFLLVVLDVSFFSFLPIHGATIISVFIVAIFIALTSDTKNIFNFSFASIIFLSALSSLPMFLIFIGFLVLPLINYYLKVVLFKDLNIVLAMLMMFFSTAVFYLIMMIYTGAWGNESLISGWYFVLINSLLGTVMYEVYLRIRLRFARGEVKFR